MIATPELITQYVVFGEKMHIGENMRIPKKTYGFDKKMRVREKKCVFDKIKSCSRKKKRFPENAKNGRVREKKGVFRKTTLFSRTRICFPAFFTLRRVR